MNFHWQTAAMSRALRRIGSPAAVLSLFLLGSNAALAGGPKYVAGVTYFNPAVLGQPVVWPGGQVHYYVDQGSLGPLSNAQASAMVDAAAAIWNSVPTAAVNLSDAGHLAEDVNGSNVLALNGSFAAPGDVTPNAIGTPVAVIFDSDGSVIDSLEGSGASQPDDCELNSMLFWIDNMTPNANLAHGVIVLNGRCATSANLLAMMSYQLERAFGSILGLDFSQVNDNALTTNELNGPLGWPIMQPVSFECGPSGGSCIPNPAQIRYDDVAALSRIYPVTSANQSSFPGKQLTAASTVSIQGTINFRNGQGMQGVNVVARPLDANGNPLYQYTVTFVSGSYFAGNRGNSITGFTDSQGNRFDRFGSSDPALEGYFDLSAIPLPPGVTSANYQISFEAVNPLYIDSVSVGPYVLGSPKPSGTASAVAVNGMHAGSTQLLTVNVANSAGQARPVSVSRGPKIVPDGPGIPRIAAAPIRRPALIGTESDPTPLPASGAWTSTLSQIGRGDWFVFPVQGNRTFTIIAQALDETGTPSSVKAMPAIGVWDGFDPVETAAAAYAAAANGTAPGETWLQVATAVGDTVRMGIEDQRGDGRPDYTYRGWVLYADSVSPTRLPAAGGAIVIKGMGFHTGDTVMVGNAAAQVTSILPNEITAIAPAAHTGVTGSQDVTVNDLPAFHAFAVISGGVSYDSATGDSLNLVTAPSNQVPLNVPQPFSVIALGADGNPAGGVTVLYSIASGTATLGCGQLVCSVTTTGDGRATLQVTATSTAIAVVTASLTDGASIQAHFYGGISPVVSALTSTLYLAAGAAIQWPVQALVLNGGVPLAGQQVTWQNVSGISAPAPPSQSNSAGVASATLTVGPLAEGATATSNACISGTSNCAAFSAFGSRPEFATLSAVSGAGQSIPLGATPAPVVLRVQDMNGNPLAGATVTVTQALYSWAPPCPPHGRCAQAQLLMTESANLTSALDGSVTIAPLTSSGVPTSLQGIAATGNSSSLRFTVEQHP